MQNPSAGVKEFRTDINGIRAWAVMAVVLYHFGFPGARGGFLGVDIFFVISGFLMTEIVVKGLERQSLAYSVLDFYLARARRIIPALAVLCLALLSMGWFLLPSPDYKKLADHSALSLLFVSNIQYLKEAGYFDVLSHEKWLLHTWSLSVEWQFYVLFPLLTKALWRFKPQREFLMLVFSVLALVSFLFCAWQTPEDASKAFYLLHSRAWELLLGGLASLVMHRRPSAHPHPAELPRFQFWYGLGALSIFMSLVLVSSNDPWPGWRALFPVLGTCLMLYFKPEKSPLTDLGILQWLGDRSYSIYLWHWPVVVAFHFRESQNALFWTLLGIFLSLAAGALSFRWVEKTTRKSMAQMTRPQLGVCLFSLLTLAIGFSSFVILQKGMPGRLDPIIETILKERDHQNPREKECHVETGIESPACLYGGSKISAIVMGDSHANALVNAVAEARASKDDGILEWSYSACPVLSDVRMVNGKVGAKHQCQQFMATALQRLDAEYLGVPVIIISRWAQYAIGRNEKPSEANVPWVSFGKTYPTSTPEFLEEFSNKLVSTACQLAKVHPVFLVRPIPEMGVDVPSTLARKYMWGAALDVYVSKSDYLKRQQFVWDAQDRAHRECGVEILDPTPALCKNEKCSGVEDRRALYFDDDHLSEFGNRKLVPMFRNVFK